MVSLEHKGRLITEPREIALAMMNGLLPDDDLDVKSMSRREIRINAEQKTTVFEEVVTSMDKLKMAVRKQRNGKAPGHNGITVETVERAFGRISTMLLHMINRIFKTGEFHGTWKKGVLRVFLKGTDKSKSLIK